MNESDLEKSLKEIGYLTSEGEVSKKYIFSAKQVNWDEDCKVNLQSKKFLKRLIGKRNFEIIEQKHSQAIKDAADYHNLGHGFQRGDFQRHLYNLFLKEEINKTMKIDYNYVFSKN